MAYFEANDGTRLFYKDWGAGKPVVLVHGWCIHSDSWEYTQGELASRGLRCLAYDQRGCGRSDQPWDGYDYDTLAGDLAALLETLDLREATLVGHSMGTGVIARYLASHGDARVARAVLVAGTTPFPLKTEDNPDGIDRIYLDAALASMKRDRPRHVMGLVPSFFGPDLPSESVSQEMIDWAVSITLQASMRAAVEMQRTCATTDQRREMTEIRVPTLIMHGDSDPSCPLELTGRKSHALIPNSRLLVYEGAAHGFYIDRAPQFNADLLAFIEGDGDFAK